MTTLSDLKKSDENTVLQKVDVNLAKVEHRGKL